ncbi:hypothetical protein HIM_02693 [Hirsutella minnesotensis 3608]|nr:hypothetical protein HIM_02693 [Hirsutella minnesotensis 3608]
MARPRSSNNKSSQTDKAVESSLTPGSVDDGTNAGVSKAVQDAEDGVLLSGFTGDIQDKFDELAGRIRKDGRRDARRAALDGRRARRLCRQAHERPRAPVPPHRHALSEQAAAREKGRQGVRRRRLECRRRSRCRRARQDQVGSKVRQ